MSPLERDALKVLGEVYPSSRSPKGYKRLFTRLSVAGLAEAEIIVDSNRIRSWLYKLTPKGYQAYQEALEQEAKNGKHQEGGTHAAA